MTRPTGEGSSLDCRATRDAPTTDEPMTMDDSRQRAALERAMELSLSYLGSLDAAPVCATASLAELRMRFAHPLPEQGVDPVTVIDELARDSAGGLVGTAGGRFYGWVIGAGLPAALAADWLTAAWDQNAGLAASGPAAAVVEEVCGTWLKDVLGLPATASYALVTGCQMAHVTCLAAARHAVLARAGWDVNRDGLAGAPSLRIVTSAEVHGTVTRAVKLIGIGTANMVVLPSDPAGRLAPRVIKDALAYEPRRPTVVVLQAGDVNCGVFDPFAELIPLAREAGAWVHIDGAMGLWCHAAPELRHLLAGAALADSWATDGHKWLNVPYDCGYAFVAHPEHHRAAMEHRASYLVHAEAARDGLDWTPEHSRRARAFSTWAALRELGRAGLADLVGRCCRHAYDIVTRIGALPGARAMCIPQINQGLVRFHDPRPGATEQDHDRRTDAVMAAINATGEAFFTGTTWRGMRCMRVSVSSWRTTAGDVDRAVAAAARVLQPGANQPGPPVPAPG
jgi:glutamate/tyrosine decarboxylase-like PLP-dependent enzyme